MVVKNLLNVLSPIQKTSQKRVLENLKLYMHGKN